MVQAGGRNVRDIPNVLLNLDDCTPPFISSAKCVRFILYIFFIDVGTEESGTRGKFIRAADSTETRQSCEKTPPVSQLALSLPLGVNVYSTWLLWALCDKEEAVWLVDGG